MLKEDMATAIPKISFSSTQRKQILDSTKSLADGNSPDSLFSEMENLANDYIEAKVWENRLRTYELKKIFDNLDSSVGRIQRKLYCYEGKIPLEIRAYLMNEIQLTVKQEHPRTTYRERMKIVETEYDNLLHYLGYFGKITQSVLPVIESRITNTKTIHDKDEATMALFDLLCSLWRCYFATEPGTSWSAWDKQNIGGPFVRFISAFLHEIQESLPADFCKIQPEINNISSMSNAAIRDRIRQSKQYLPDEL